MKTAICDCCNKQVAPNSGYLLSSEQVVSSSLYWQHYFDMHRAEFKALGADTYNDFCLSQLIYKTCIKFAQDPTPWMICENCISLFKVDKKIPRAYADQFWASGGTVLPSTAPAPLSAIDLGDGKRWYDAESVSQNVEVTETDSKKETISRSMGSILWELKCKTCGEYYHIGENSQLITDEDVRSSVRDTGIILVIPSERQPELAHRAAISDEVWSKMQKVTTKLQDDLAKGLARRWYCEKCRTLNEYPVARNQKSIPANRPWWRFW